MWKEMLDGDYNMTDDKFNNKIHKKGRETREASEIARI
jgi:hypothetical protein